MKMMLVSISIIIAICICSIYNCKKANEHTSELLDSIEALQGADDIDGIEALCALWEDHRTFFVSTIPTDKVERADRAFLILQAASKSGNKDDFIEGIIFAFDAIRELALFSSFSIQNIL